MITQLCGRLAQHFYTQGACPESQVPWIQYKLELWFGRAVTYPCILAIAALSGYLNLGSFFPSILLIGVWVLLRAFIGGYHADSRRDCFFASLALYAICVFGLAPLLSQSVLACTIILILCGVCIFIWAPYIHPNCYCSEGNDVKVRQASCIVYSLVVVALILCLVVGAPVLYYGYAISGMLACVSLMLYAKINNVWKGKSHE